MKLLVTGAHGQLASKLADRNGSDGLTVLSAGRPDCDITDEASVRRVIAENSPDAVVNAAAYTAVDQAESEPELAFAVNRDGAGNVARASDEAGIPVIHVSTDYVFAGDKPEPYVEDDPTGPTGIYGQSKLEGEWQVAASNPRHLVFRTAWVFSDTGNNFVKTMLRLAADRDELGVVADQFGNPTDAADLADGIIVAARKLLAPNFSEYGTYHLSGSGSTSWAGLARHAFSVSEAIGGPSAEVRDITTAEYPTPAKRPANSRLSNEKFVRAFDWRMPDWHESCEKTVRALVGSHS